MKKEITVSVTFSTLQGRKNVLWSLEEALKTDLCNHVQNILKDQSAVGCEIQHPLYGRVNIDLVGKF